MNAFKPGQTVMITLESSEFYKRKGVVVTATGSQVKIKVDGKEYWYWDDEAVVIEEVDNDLTKQVMDWQCGEHWKEEAESAQREVHLLTMQNEDLKRLYAAENERADQLETHFQDFIKIAERWSEDLCKAEAREKKLREAIEEIKRLGYSDRWGGGYIYTGDSHATAVRIAARILASLYPEEETK